MPQTGSTGIARREKGRKFFSQGEIFGSPSPPRSSHRRESSFPFRSSVSLATPLINSRTGGGRKGFPYLRQRFCSHNYLRVSFAVRTPTSLSSRTRTFFSLLFRQLADVHVSILRARALLKPDLHDSLSPTRGVTGCSYSLRRPRSFTFLKRYFFINIKRKTTHLYISPRQTDTE